MIIKHFDLITIMALTFKLVRSLKKKKKTNQTVVAASTSLSLFFSPLLHVFFKN